MPSPGEDGIGVTILALVAAIHFTAQYPVHVRSNAMQKMISILVVVGCAAFLAGRWSQPGIVVKADSGDNAAIQVQTIRGDTGLTVYYPGLKKMFVYQSPFVGLPTWNCAYSIQLSTPGGSVERQPCADSGQQFQNH